MYIYIYICIYCVILGGFDTINVYNDVTASRDVTYLFTYPDEICTAYIKLNSKQILFTRIFLFSINFSR